VPFTISLEGIPSKTMLNILPNPSDRKSRKEEMIAGFLNELLKLPKKESDAIANSNIPNERMSFNELMFPATSIPTLALISIGLKLVKPPIPVRISPEMNK
jgi:hypothetical protein